MTDVCPYPGASIPADLPLYIFPLQTVNGVMWSPDVKDGFRGCEGCPYWNECKERNADGDFVLCEVPLESEITGAILESPPTDWENWREKQERQAEDNDLR